MIPPTNMIQDQSDGKDDERDDGETPPQSPATSVTQPETKNTVRPDQKKRKLQRLKRSLSFKTKTVRSKSADNFFRSSNDNKTELLCDGSSSSTGHLSTMAPPHSIPPVPPAIPSAPPSSSRSPARNAFELDSAGHCFMEHIFKKPTFCDVCNHMIVGTTAKHVVFLAGNTAKHGLRCKACKMSLHHKCESGVLYMQQRCMGKLPKGFRRYYSSPLLIQEQFGIIKEVMPIACGNKVDPVYEALRMGTSLAQKAKRTSGSESPHSLSTSDLDKVPEEVAADHSSRHELSRKHSDDVFTVVENGTEPYHQPERMPEDSPEQTQLQEDDLLNTYVALYSYTPQDTHDLEMRPGERIIVADDSNDDWWKGLIEDRIGFFPSSYAHPLRPGDQVFRCSRTFIGCKEQGQITLKEGQICVSCEDECSGFIKVSCGKRIGHVPCDVLENI